MNEPTEPVMVRLQPALKQKLREHAARQQCSMSAVVVQLVQAHFELADALEREDTPREAHNLAVITGEHDFSDLNLEEGS